MVSGQVDVLCPNMTLEAMRAKAHAVRARTEWEAAGARRTSMVASGWSRETGSAAGRAFPVRDGEAGASPPATVAL